jgi:hypothetical protein
VKLQITASQSASATWTHSNRHRGGASRRTHRHRRRQRTRSRAHLDVHAGHHTRRSRSRWRAPAPPRRPCCDGKQRPQRVTTVDGERRGGAATTPRHRPQCVSDTALQRQGTAGTWRACNHQTDLRVGKVRAKSVASVRWRLTSAWVLRRGSPRRLRRSITPGDRLENRQVCRCPPQVPRRVCPRVSAGASVYHETGLKPNAKSSIKLGDDDVDWATSGAMAWHKAQRRAAMKPTGQGNVTFGSTTGDFKSTNALSYAGGAITQPLRRAHSAQGTLP